MVLMHKIARRLAISVFIVIGVSIVNFILLNAAPGSPVNALVDPNAGPAVQHQVEVQLGLNQPLPVQYYNWAIQALHGNLGYSFATYQPVTTVIAQHFVPTAELVVTAFILAYIFGIILGVVSALRPYSKVDVIATTTGLLGISMPAFVLGLVFVYLFALKLPLFPTGGQESVGGGGFSDLVSHMVMPVIVLAVFDLAVVTRYTRSSMLEVLNQDYVRTAIGKGMPQRVVVLRHALRNALSPLVTLAGLSLPRLIGGAVVVESVFQWPGLGQLAIQSVQSRDYPTLMALNLIFTVLVIVGNLLADITYAVINPKVSV